MSKSLRYHYDPLPDDFIRAVEALCDTIAKGKVPLSKVISELRREAIKRVLAMSHGNRTEASRNLGVHVTTIYHYIDRYGFHDPIYNPRRRR